MLNDLLFKSVRSSCNSFAVEIRHLIIFKWSLYVSNSLARFINLKTSSNNSLSFIQLWLWIDRSLRMIVLNDGRLPYSYFNLHFWSGSHHTTRWRIHSIMVHSCVGTLWSHCFHGLKYRWILVISSLWN